MFTGKIGRNGRTTVPRLVLSALQLKAGDGIAYAIEGERAIMTRASAEFLGECLSTFSEWATDADREAYRRL